MRHLSEEKGVALQHINKNDLDLNASKLQLHTQLYRWVILGGLPATSMRQLEKL